MISFFSDKKENENNSTAIVPNPHFIVLCGVVFIPLSVVKKYIHMFIKIFK